MNRMKRHLKCFGALLAACLLTAASGCKGRNANVSTDMTSSVAQESEAAPTEAPVNAYQLYTQALEKEKGLSDSSIAITGKLVAEAMGTKVTSDVSGKIQMHEDGENSRFLQEMSYKAMGQNIPMAVYFTDGWYYDSGCKQKTTWERFNENMTDDAMSFAEKELRDIEVTEQAGNTVIKGVVSSQNIKDYLQSTVSLLGGSVDGYADVLYSDPSLEYTINPDGWMIAYSLSFEISGQVESDDFNNPGETKMNPATLSVDFAYTLENPGQTVDVTFPEDLDEYVELPESKLSIQEILYIDSFLFDENGDPVENFDEIYSAFAQVYGEDTLDAIYYREQVT